MAIAGRLTGLVKNAGIAGTLVTAEELPHWLKRGVQFYIHSDPFLRRGLAGIHAALGR